MEGSMEDYCSDASSDCSDGIDHPGNLRTIGQRGSNRPAMKYLNRHVVANIAACWQEVGYELLETEREDEIQLNTIKSEPGLNNKERAIKMLTLWRDKNPCASWNDLIKALRVPSIGLFTTAVDIEAKLLPEVNHPAEHENEPITASDVTTDVEKFFMRKNSDEQQQQACEDDALQETQAEDQQQSEIVVHSSNPTPLQHQCTSTGSTACTVKGTKQSESVNAIGTTGSQLLDSKLENGMSETSRRVCQAVSQYYVGQFMYEWMHKTNHSPINNLAALLVERDGEMRVVVLTAGITQKRECSYPLNNENIDECIWGHCDGHAVSMCYRFACLYLITEMYRYENKSEASSILTIQPGGYALKKSVKLHFFCSDIPCGFMADEDCYFLSWKIPFKQTPHCLHCSSTILISAYLGIQGFLSHLFSKPVYISSITIPKCEGVTISKGFELRKHFERFGESLKNADETLDSDYKFHIPDVEIGDVEVLKLFPNCFQPGNDKSPLYIVSQATQRQPENKIAQMAGTIPDVKGNFGSHVMIFSFQITEVDFCKTMISQLKDATSEFKKSHKEDQLKSLLQAQHKLSIVLNVSEALNKQATLIEKSLITCSHGGCKKEHYKPKIDEVIVQVNRLKDSLCNKTKKFKKVCKVQAVKDSILTLEQRLEDHSQCMKECLDTLNQSMRNFYNDANSMADVLTNYCDYQSTHDIVNNLLKECDAKSNDSQFYLKMLGCDWVRYNTYMRAMNNDIQKNVDKQKQHQQEHFSKHENSSRDDVDGNVEQEFQEGSQKGTIKHKTYFNLCGHRSVQVSSSQASPEDKNQQQHCKSDNNMYKDSTIIHGKFGIAFKENEVNNEETNVLDELEDVMKQKSQVEAVKSEERTLLLSDLPSSAKAGNITQKMATACAVTDQQNVSRKKLKKKKKFHVKGEH